MNNNLCCKHKIKIGRTQQKGHNVGGQHEKCATKHTKEEGKQQLPENHPVLTQMQKNRKTEFGQPNEVITRKKIHK